MKRGAFYRLAGVVVVVAAAAVGSLLLGRRDSRVELVDPAAYFDPGHRQLAAEYAGTKYSLWAAATILRWGALAGIVLLGGGHVLARLGRRLGRGRQAPAAFFAAAGLLLLLAVVSLPIVYASGFHTEHAFGLSTQSRAAWALDTAKRQGFWITVYSLAAAGFLACLARWPRHGWLVAAAGGTLIAGVGTLLAPVAIDPLFHDFRPLDDVALRREIVAMGERAGLDVGQVQVMDASRRTRRLNAYVTGLGATRRVVLYDNLLERAPQDELMLVVAHEIAHAARHHVRRGLLWSIPGILAGAWLLALVARWQARRDAAGLTGSGDPAGLPLLWLAVSLFLFLSSPLESAISRRMEAEADWIALELTRDPDTFVAVEQRLVRTNLAPVTPPAWIVTWLYSHPPVLERIGMAEYWRRHSTGAEPGPPSP